MIPYRLSVVAMDDPYPLYREYRDRDPVHYSSEEDLWVLTRFEDVSAAFRDWRTWSSKRRGNLVNDMPERIGRTLGTSDPPDHRLARGIVEKAFTRRTVQELAPQIDALATHLSRQAAHKGSVDVVDAVSTPFNAGVLGAMFGVPDSDFLDLRRWLDDFFLREEAQPGIATKQSVAMARLREYLDDLATERVRRPGTDLISTMLLAETGGRRLNREQVVITTMTFLTAGFESTNNVITNLVYALGLYPDLWRQLRADPSLIPAFVEEGMRWDAAAQGFVRTPNRTVQLHGRTIEEGAQVLLHIGAANRDERAFADPDRFDIGRTVNRHLGFGMGIHFCVGAPLGREMAKALIGALVAESRRWDVDVRAGERVQTPNFRGFSNLPLEM